MKIVFLAHKTRTTRHFESVILALAERGHEVCIAALPMRGRLRVPEALIHPRVSVALCPGVRVDGWRGLTRPIRVARDYVRFLNPRFAGARRLRRRADERAASSTPGLKRLCERHAWVRRCWRLLDRASALAEDLVPSDRAFEEFLRAERPDAVLMTRLIDFGSYQTDYVKAAHRLGLPIAFLPFSWDNLTVKGHIRVIPDRVLVWNDIQKREAIELHGVPPAQVVVAGAPRFDEFFAMRPSTTRAEFCARVGLDPERPFILYLCSAPFVGPYEVDFVRRWVGEVRASSDPALRACGLLVRPHPVAMEQWDGVDLSDLPGVAVSGARLVNADPGLYDALHHAATVVGLSTSAFIEAGILGKPTHTILTPEFEGQEGTVHFGYLLREQGGLVRSARDFDEHRRQLAEALAPGEADREQILRFLERFVRPYGLEVPATPITVYEVERLAELGLRKRPRRTPFWHRPARWALRTWLRGRVTPSDADPADDDRDPPLGEPAHGRAGAAPGRNGAAGDPRRAAAVAVEAPGD